MDGDSGYAVRVGSVEYSNIIVETEGDSKSVVVGSVAYNSIIVTIDMDSLIVVVRCSVAYKSIIIGSRENDSKSIVVGSVAYKSIIIGTDKIDSYIKIINHQIFDSNTCLSIKNDSTKTCR
jgi:hypothetical protein